MTAKAPTSLPNPRNISLDKGTIPGGFAEPNLTGVKFPIPHDDAAIDRTPGGQAPGGPSPFGNTRGGR